MSYLEINTPHYKVCMSFLQDMEEFRQRPLANAPLSEIIKQKNEFLKYLKEVSDYDFKNFKQEAIQEMCKTQKHFAGLISLAQLREGIKPYELKTIKSMIRRQRLDDLFDQIFKITKDRQLSKTFINAILNNELPHVVFDEQITPRIT